MRNLFKILCVLMIANLFFQNYKVEAQTPNIRSITSMLTWAGSHATGVYSIYRDGNNINSITFSNIRKPFIIVSPFDPNNSYNVQSVFDAFDNSDTAYGVRETYPVFGDPSGPYEDSTLAQRINARGYDIIVLDYDNGGDLIERNAMLLVELLNEINAAKPGTSGQNTVAGYSMGGLVARFALTFMESNSNAHDTKLFISYDAPQKGAHIPLAIQQFALNLSGLTSLSSELAAAINQFECPAAQEMLKYSLTDSFISTEAITVKPSPAYTTFMKELNGLNSCNGYPQFCHNVGISLGSWNSKPQTSLLDHSGSGTLDPQYSSQIAIEINTVGLGSGGWISALNVCGADALAYQAQLATGLSENYPYYHNLIPYFPFYLSGGDTIVPATYVIFPTELFTGGQNIYKCQDASFSDEPRDFEPGSSLPVWQEVADACNAQFPGGCTYNYMSNATFIPTVSSLAYDDNYFTSISTIPDRLAHTPFDDIIGIIGDDQSHVTLPANYSSINDFIVHYTNDNPVFPSYPSTCSTTGFSISPRDISASYYNIGSVPYISNVNHFVIDGPVGSTAPGNAKLQASKYIKMEPGLNVKLGGKLIANIVPCLGKPCSWSPTVTHSDYRTASASDTELSNASNAISQVQNINAIKLNANNSKGDTAHVSSSNLFISIYPNPATNKINIISNIVAGSYTIKNAMGQDIYKGNFNNNVSIGMDIEPGIYVINIFSDGVLFKVNKLVIER